MSKKNDPNQLMLDFEHACTEFQQASVKMVEAAQAVQQSQTSKKQKKATKKALSDERRLFNKLVRCYAYHKLGGDYAAAYTTVYYHMRDQLDCWCQDQPPKTSIIQHLDDQGLIPRALDELHGLMAG